MSRATAFAIAATLLTAAAHADAPPPPTPRHTVAVLEYRAGAVGARDLGARLAKQLGDTAALDVLDPQAARRRLGPRVDGEVARCSGDAACIGAIGTRLGADEVLLVGVSQLGDIIIALQRIETRAGVAGARLAESLPPDGDITTEQLLGWLRQLFPPDVFRRYGTITIAADQPAATVLLNDEAAGKTPLQPLNVRAPGSYQLRLEKNGFAPFSARIDVLPDANVEVHATLVRQAGVLPWYKRWYVWATVGGVIAAAGVATAVYFGTRVDQQPLGYIMRPTTP